MATFQLPLFPLQTVLFPHGMLSLRIFEVRYLDLMQRCRKDDAPFGVVCLQQGSEVRRAPTEGEGTQEPEVLHDVGTLAYIEHFERPQPGLMLVRCRGGRRFRLLGTELLKHGLWTGEVELLEEEPHASVPADLVPVRDSLRKLYEHLHTHRSGADGADGPSVDDLPIQPPLQWDDCGWLADRWCDMLPISPQLKQKFLNVDSPLLRLELIGDLLHQLGMGEPPRA